MTGSRSAVEGSADRVGDEVVLKGGSLNRTAIVTVGGRKVIRKSIDRVADREYGFVRWYSQMKRLQRYNSLFPGLFPELLDVGGDGQQAYFDIEFFGEAYDLKRFLIDLTPEEEAARRAHEALWRAMDRIHGHRLFAPRHSLALYYREEVEQKLRDAMRDRSFAEFARNREIVFDGTPVPSLVEGLDWCAEVFRSAEVRAECFTHGNVTLENVLYLPGEDRIVFIDPYDENIVDCAENEYSQVLQCSKSHYGFVNDRTVKVEANRVARVGDPPAALHRFDALFQARLADRLDAAALRLVALFELSQFVRMLPFKVLAGDGDKAKYFYGLASSLLHRLRNAHG